MKEIVLALIDEAGIKSGFDEALDYIREHGIEKDFDKPFPIAICNITAEDEEEKEAKLNYNFDHQLIRDIGSVSFRELADAGYFDEGEVIAFIVITSSSEMAAYTTSLAS